MNAFRAPYAGALDDFRHRFTVQRERAVQYIRLPTGVCVKVLCRGRFLQYTATVAMPISRRLDDAAGNFAAVNNNILEMRIKKPVAAVATANKKVIFYWICAIWRCHFFYLWVAASANSMAEYTFKPIGWPMSFSFLLEILQN